MLLAYYIAAVNIEAAFHDLAGGEYRPFEGIVLTDTFQLAEGTARLDGMDVLEGNSERAKKQQKQKITVVIGNPPYSVGQDSQNDNNQNLSYEVLDQRIADTYVARTKATNKSKLYDSYIRSIRWASDRIDQEGIVAYVSNGGYIDGTSADGLRKCLVDEFDAIYCYNLRGNQRTAGEQSRKEGGKIFGSGSRNTVAILLLVKGGPKNSKADGCTLHYRDIGDYLTREDKLSVLASQSLDAVPWEQIKPSPEGDWINQRNQRFAAFRAIGEKDKARRADALFEIYSNGLLSSRDAWVYNFLEGRLEHGVRALTNFYNDQVAGFEEHCRSNGIVTPSIRDAERWVATDSARISWSSSLLAKLLQGKRIDFDPTRIVTAQYRPFCRQAVYFDKDLIHRPGQLPLMFPTVDSQNFGFYVTGAGSDKPFSVHAIGCLPDVSYWGSSVGQFFPRYTYRDSGEANDLFAVAGDGSQRFQRVDNISDAALKDFRRAYPGATVSKDDIFYYVYALLHSPEYRGLFSSDLKKSLPRIPKVSHFGDFADAGRKLTDLHIRYEQMDPHQGVVETVAGDASTTPLDELYRVGKMKFARVKGVVDRSTILYNHRVTLSNIPEEAYRYQLGARSAIEWIIDRYQVKTDKDSGIVNDPNDWSDDPRYVADLLKRVVTVSVETMKIVDGLPSMEILD
ncbi:type ISP restriction/modification enzyme [Micromonospora echinofusca]|uniref:type ISP restriction/modification enzyme n=1 Tax=Micromonospora echinofusca TaxID=47858 RepID=UPI0027DD48A1|nr:type ISP restriction/modification enzyme [Micromonospora echinofusca]